MRTRQYLLSLICTVLFTSLWSPSEAQDMQKQFDTFKGEASKWQEYTMFKHNRLDEFWSVVSDTLAKNQNDLATANQKINKLSRQLDSLGMALKNTKAELQASEEVNASIGFLGIEVNKIFYNIVVWAIIAGLCGAVAIIYMMFKTSNKVTRTTKNDYTQLAQEFGDYKEKATKKQISLKRELQTAINTLEDNRIKVSNKLGYNKGSSTIS